MKMTTLFTMVGLVSLAASGCTTDTTTDPSAGSGAVDDATKSTTPCEKIDAAYGGLFSQLGYDGHSSLEVYLPSAGNDWNMAQVFAPSTAGRLSRVRLALTWSGRPPGDVVVSLIDLGGNPAHLTDRTFLVEDHIIATTDVAVSSEESWVNVPFANQPAVIAGKPYAIEVHVAGPAAKNTKVFGDGAVLWDAFAALPASTIDPYPTGKAFVRNPSTANQWVATPTAFGVSDQVFETYVIGANCR
jgi:hypothetical protein